MTLINNFIGLFIESAPWLMLGLLIAGVMKEWLPSDFLSRHLGDRSTLATIKAAFIGAPFPLCSCGVIPAALGLRRNGASKGATTAFLIATPETGVDSVSVSYALLGPFLTIIRPIAAITSAITAGFLVGSEPEPVKEVVSPTGNCSDSSKETSTKTSSCCSSKSQPSQSVKEVASSTGGSSDSSKEASTKASSCCSSKSQASQPVSKGAVERLQSGLHFATHDLIKDISTWLLIGLGFAALIQTYVSVDYLSQWGGSIWSMLLMVLISIPMYICATASTPIAAGLLLSGISPGAVLVFMLAGPATNIATIGVVYKELGKRAVGGYLIGVIGVALIFGFMTDWMIGQFSFSVTPLNDHHHSLLPTWLSISTSLLLAYFILSNYLKRGINSYVNLRK